MIKKQDLLQPHEHACEETVAIEVFGNVLENVRVVGPLRKQTQCEVLFSDTYKLKTVPPIRLSGDLKDSSPFDIVGPKGVVKKQED